LARIESAVAVQVKGVAVALYAVTKRSILARRSATVRNEPRRIAC